MKKYCFLFILLVISGAHAEEFRASITKDKTALEPYDELHITIEVEHPAAYQADVRSFLSEMKSNFFHLVSNSVQDTPTKLGISLTLLPSRLGSLVFMPPILFFSSKTEKRGVAISGFEIPCEAISQEMEFAPLSPLYPEKRVALSAQEKSSLFSKESVSQEFQKTIQDIQKRTFAWTSLVVSFLVIGFSVALGAAFVEYRLSLPKKTPRVARDLQKELMELSHDTSVPSIRFAKLSSFLRAFLGELSCQNLEGHDVQSLVQLLQNMNFFSEEEQSELSRVLEQLEAYEFSNMQEMDAREVEDAWTNLMTSRLHSILLRYLQNPPPRPHPDHEDLALLSK